MPYPTSDRKRSQTPVPKKKRYPKPEDPVSDDDKVYRTYDGRLIDKEIMKKYLKEVKESEGFHFSKHPGSVFGLTDIMPLQFLLDNREKHPEHYDNIMDLAAIALKKFNKEYQRNFRVIQIDKLNVNASFTTEYAYYITFTAVDVKRPYLSSLFEKLVTTLKIIMLTLMLWMFYIPFIAPFDRMKKRLGFKWMKLKSAQELKARKHELENGSADRMMFEALAYDDELYRTREVTFCRIAKTLGPNPRRKHAKKYSKEVKKIELYSSEEIDRPTASQRKK